MGPRSFSALFRTRRTASKSLKSLARPKRFELLTPRFVVWCSIQLSYGRAREAGCIRSLARDQGRVWALSGFGRRDRGAAEVWMARIVEAIGRHTSGALTCVEAASLLGMSERHFRRLRLGARVRHAAFTRPSSQSAPDGAPACATAGNAGEPRPGNRRRGAGGRSPLREASAILKLRPVVGSPSTDRLAVEAPPSPWPLSAVGTWPPDWAWLAGSRESRCFMNAERRPFDADRPICPHSRQCFA